MGWLAAFITACLVVIKLAGFANISWLVVFSPILVVVGVSFILMLVAGITGLLFLGRN